MFTCHVKELLESYWPAPTRVQASALCNLVDACYAYSRHSKKTRLYFDPISLGLVVSVHEHITYQKSP